MKTQKDSEFRALFNAAHEAGVSATRYARPRLTRVVKVEADGTVVDYGSEWASDDAALGYCGYAWVRIRPATNAFARWCKAQSMAQFGSPDRRCGEYDPNLSGLIIDVDRQIPREIDRSGQSYEIRMAYAKAFAAMLQLAGYSADADGRLD